MLITPRKALLPNWYSGFFRKIRYRLFLTSVSLYCLFSHSAQAQQTFADFAEFQQVVVATMGAEKLQRIEYSAYGWEACLGQPWNIANGWARWEIKSYHRVIDYANTTSYQTAQRRAGLDPDALGGCGAQPDADTIGQRSSVTENSNWSQQLQIWLTPQGFLELTANQNVILTETEEGYRAALSVTNADTEYSFTGHYSKDFLLQKISTWVDNSIFGDMLVEAMFTDYQSFNGILFPTSIVQKQGGFSTLELTIDILTPNTTASSEPPSSNGSDFGGGGSPAQEVEPVTVIGDGIYVINGGYQSVIVEFDEYIVVIDGLQNDVKSRDIIRLAKQTIPNKPIAYVISTHLHFDHAGGLREFIAEGATIITHQMNEEFLQTALSSPRTLNPNATSTTDLPVNIQGVGDTFIIDDGTQRIELYKLNGSSHADDMLIAYLPAIKTIVEADLLQPWINPVFAGNSSGPHPYLVFLADELARLDLGYEQFVPIHRPNPAPLMSRDDLMDAVKE